MEARHEIIPFDSNSPIRLFTHKLGDVTRHWHESLELLFVLAGEVTVLAGGLQYTLEPDDMLLINSNVVHELHSEDCVNIAVQIKLSKFDLPENLLDILYFDCNSTTAASPEKFSNLKRIIASMLQVNAVGSELTLFRNRSLAYELLNELVQHFKAEKPAGESNTRKHLDRLNSILRYIGSHYQEQLTLGQLAEREHLSAPYLSSFFEKYMGINFSTYYTNLRLEHAVRDLLCTDIPVEQVALNSGFSDPRSFVRAFKKRYNMVPSAYRKQAATPALQVQEDPLLAINYLDFKPENYFHILSQYLPQPSSAPVAAPQNTQRLAIGTVDSAAKGRRLRHSWRTFVGVGRAKDLLYGDVQDMLRQLQQKVGFQYLRFHGIFSDDMLVCQRDKAGALRYNFTLIDKALDFILSVGLKPLVQFSFMPAAIAEDPRHTVFSNPVIVSPPASMSDWNQLVFQFLVHLRDRYGQQELRTWLYSVWNEPDTSREMFGFEDRRRFFSLYESTWRTVKLFDSRLCFGSPSMFPVTEDGYGWLREFLDFTRTNDCVPQFMDVHYYSDNFMGFAPDVATFNTPSRFNDDPDHFSKFLDRVQLFLREEHLEKLPLYLTEWNLTVSHRNLINDTCFKATHLVKNFLENYDRTDAIGYWCLTDFLDELLPVHPLFHGGMGLFTRSGIKKPPCYAMEMLRRLGDTLVDAGQGWFITRREDGSFAAIFYNYEHCNPLFVDEGLGLTATSRSGVFPLRAPLEVSLALTGLSSAAYRIRETVLNEEHGSCFDRWAAMGGTELGAEEEDWLRRSTAPDLRISQAVTGSGHLSYTALLGPQEVRLTEFIPVEQGRCR